MPHAEKWNGSKKKVANFWFTLVELIVVITILAILATVGFLALSGYSQDAKDATVKANVRSVQTAISAESAVTNNSPRYYVVHETGAALSDGTVAYVDGNPVALTGGQYGTANTNYSAWNPDWAKLKLNPDKFRLSSLGARFADAFGTAGAAYDPKAVSVGAVDAALAPTSNGRNRSASFFQVAAVSPATKAVSVAGNFPAPTAAQVSAGAAAGLVKAQGGTGAMVDGGTGWTQNNGGASASSANPATPAFVTWTAYSSGQSFSYVLPSGTSVIVEVLGTGVGKVPNSKTSHAPACDTDDIVIWSTTGLPQIWAACNLWATSAMPVSNMKFDGTADIDASNAQFAGGFYQWWYATDLRNLTTWFSDAGNDAWGNVTNTNDARRGPCPAGYRVPNGGRNVDNTAEVSDANEWQNAYAIAASIWAGTVCSSVSNQYERLRCVLRLPRAGYKKNASYTPYDIWTIGHYWSSSPFSTSARDAEFWWLTGNTATSKYRSSALSVRCLKN